MMGSESENSGEWFSCPACNCFLDSLPNYEQHYLFKHNKTLNDEIRPPPPVPSKTITIFPSQIDIIKLSYQELGRAGQGARCKDKTNCKNPTPQKQPEAKGKGLKQHPCDICSKTFNARAFLERHILTWHTKVKPFKCTQCGKGFCRTDSLRSHQRTHSEAINYSCEHCDKKFRFQSSYSAHINSEHTADKDRKKFQCPDCPTHFFTQGKLATHLEKVHKIMKEKKFQCDLCSKRLLSSTAFKNHLLMHTSEKHYQCDICSRTFTQKSNLTTHKKTHERNRPRPISCDKCDKTFVTNQQLKYHNEGVHEKAENFHCPICNKGFAHKQTLSVHLTRHVAERHHKCELCEKSFKHASSLKMHIRLHLGEKQYRCDKCGKGYTQRVNLDWHKKNMCGKVRTRRKKNKSS